MKQSLSVLNTLTKVFKDVLVYDVPLKNKSLSDFDLEYGIKITTTRTGIP